MKEALSASVYGLCFLTSLTCAWMLGRSFVRSRGRLLFWSAICFGLLAANNLILVFDVVVWPAFDLKFLRILLSLAAVLSLVWGFTAEFDRK